jgi:hypothetical protein
MPGDEQGLRSGKFMRALPRLIYAVQQAMEDLPMKPVPLGVSKQIASVMALDSYPFSTGALGSVDQVRLQRVADVMQQFPGLDSSFNINSMLTGG